MASHDLSPEEPPELVLFLLTFIFSLSCIGQCRAGGTQRRARGSERSFPGIKTRTSRTRAGKRVGYCIPPLSLSIFFVAWCHRVEVAVAFCCYTTFLHNLLALRFTSTCWPSSRQFTPFIRTVMPAITRSAARAGSSSARVEEAKPYYAPRRQRHCSVPRTGDVVALRLDPALSVSHLGWDECTHAMERMEKSRVRCYRPVRYTSAADVGSLCT